MISDNILKKYENELGELKYPLIIEVPSGYWTSSATVGKNYNPNEYWHNGEDD